MERVFVYGTLKKGNPNYHVMTNKQNGVAKFACNAVTRKRYPLVVATVANIPFVLNLEGVGEHVCGEIYEVDEQMKETLDKLEVVGVFYDISRVELLTEFNEMEIAPCYVLNNPHDHLLKRTMLNSYTSAHAQTYVPHSGRVGITLNDLINQVKQV